MADIHIHRDHALGLAKARKIAWKWAEEVEQKFDMECTVIEGDVRQGMPIEHLTECRRLHLTVPSPLGSRPGVASAISVISACPACA